MIHHFDSIDSTNRHAMELARRGAGGRRGGGGGGCKPPAEGGSAVRSSRPRASASTDRSSCDRSIPPARAPQITLVAGLAVAEAVEKHAGIRPGLKWPNDVRLGSGRSPASSPRWNPRADRVLHVVCGPGINLNVPTAEFPLELRAIATSILAATGRSVDRAAFAADLFGSFERLYDEFLSQGPRSPARALGRVFGPQRRMGQRRRRRRDARRSSARYRRGGRAPARGTTGSSRARDRRRRYVEEGGCNRRPPTETDDGGRAGLRGNRPILRKTSSSAGKAPSGSAEGSPSSPGRPSAGGRRPRRRTLPRSASAGRSSGGTSPAGE